VQENGAKQSANDSSEEVTCNGFMTWSALEDSLKGVRDNPTAELVSAVSANTQKTATETGNQTDAVSGDKK